MGYIPADSKTMATITIIWSQYIHVEQRVVNTIVTLNFSELIWFT